MLTWVGGLTSSDFTGTCLVGVRCFLVVSSIAPEKIASFTELVGPGGWGVVSMLDRVDGCLKLTDSSIIIPGSSDVFSWKSNCDHDPAGSVFFVNKLSTGLVMLPLLSRTDRIALAIFPQYQEPTFTGPLKQNLLKCFHQAYLYQSP